MRNSQIETYTNKHLEKINELNDNRLNYYIIGIIEEIAQNEFVTLEEGNVLDISDDNLKLEVLESIYNNIEREEDKVLFAESVSNNASLLGLKIADEFSKKLNKLNIDNESTEETSEEELEEEQELNEPTENIDTSDSNTEETNEEEKEEELEEEENLEGPAITEYKAKTAEMEKELEELMAKLNGLTDTENTLSEMDEIINNTSYPEIEEKDNEINNVKEEIETLEKEINNKNIEKERYENLKEEYDKYYEEHNIPKTSGDYREKMAIYDQRIKEANDNVKSLSEKKMYKEQELEMLLGKKQEINGPLYVIEKWKFSELYNKEIEQLENSLKELNEIQDNLYKESKGIPLEIYGMKTKLENQIKDMKDTYNRVTGIRSEINLNNPEFKPVIDAVKNGRKINEEVQVTLQNNFGKEPKENIDNKELNDYVEKLKEDIAKRKENIVKYYDALNDIKNIGNEIKSGKTPEELKEQIDNVNNKINSITDDKLKEELNNELNKALGKGKDKDPEEPEIPKNKTKDPNKWKKWVSGLAGLALGAGIIGLTPLGLGGAIAIAAGTQVIKKGINKWHEKLKNENEVTNIEKTGKLEKFKEKIKSWIKDENIVKNINWFLNGTAIGAVSMGAIEQIAAMTQTVPSPAQPTPQNTNPNIKVGDSASGMDLSTGYDQSNWAINGTNAESLNQGIMNDGQTVVRRIMDAQGNTYMSTEEALKAGKTLQELSLDLATNSNIDRAWVNAAEAVGRTL